jgi:competence protein ComEC
MLILALNFLLGITLFSLKNSLTLSTLEISGFCLLIVAIFATFKRHKTLSINLLLFVLGFTWMGIFSAHILQKNIDEKFFNTPISVTGKIQNIATQADKKARFNLQISEPFQGKIKLSWYGKSANELKNGDIWTLLIKIKHNNGYQNQGGFDYEKWLFYQQFDATGYVRRSENNRLMAKNTTPSIDSIRQNIRQKLSENLSDYSFLGVINALVIGDRSLINKDHWALFKATNTTHLSIISGLHIGLISGFIFLLSSWLWRRCSPCMARLPATILGAYFGLFSALIYALIAGFSIPTQRAFIMAGVIFLSLILRRRHNIWQLYAVALMLVLIINPLSVFSVGFWLSFYVVAVIIYAARRHQNKPWLLRLIYIQLLISLATLPLIAGFFGAGSSLSPIANLVAIPIFSFITTPLSLLGTAFLYLNLDYLSTLSFTIADLSLDYLTLFFQFLQGFQFNQWQYSPSSNGDFVLLILAVLLALLPSPLKLRKMALILFLLIGLQPTNPMKTSEVLITTLDVGQGLAHIVRTQNHTLLFDAGARYPSGFNLGDAVITPYLRSKRIDFLDLIIISHTDNDHIGGLDAVLKNFKSGKILTSNPSKITQKSSLCQSQPSWQWDGINFQMLNLAHNFKGNNASCVLKISNQNHAILLTGDIEKKAELHLLKTWGDALKSDFLISPHHGSKTSSSQAFLAAVNPDWVVVSSGYKNRFNHPASTILQRYRDFDIQVLTTRCSGQIDVKLADKISIEQYRHTQKRYYWRSCAE